MNPFVTFSDYDIFYTSTRKFVNIQIIRKTKKSHFTRIFGILKIYEIFVTFLQKKCASKIFVCLSLCSLFGPFVAGSGRLSSGRYSDELLWRGSTASNIFFAKIRKNNDRKITPKSQTITKNITKKSLK